MTKQFVLQVLTEDYSYKDLGSYRDFDVALKRLAHLRELDRKNQVVREYRVSQVLVDTQGIDW